MVGLVDDGHPAHTGIAPSHGRDGRAKLPRARGDRPRASGSDGPAREDHPARARESTPGPTKTRRAPPAGAEIDLQEPGTDRTQETRHPATRGYLPVG